MAKIITYIFIYMALTGIISNTRILAEKNEGSSEIITGANPIINVNIPTTIADTSSGDFSSTLFGSSVNRNKTIIVIGLSTFTLETSLGTFVLIAADTPLTLTFDASEGTWISNPASPVFPSAPLSQKGEKFTGSGATGLSSQGISIAISDTEDTMAIGGPTDGTIRSGFLPIFETRGGATWIFIKDTISNKWIQQGEKLVGSGGDTPFQGASVALSSDGNILAIGGPEDSISGAGGAIWIFTRTDNVWTQKARLTPSNNLSNPNFGKWVDLNGAGTVLAVGGPNDNSAKGAVWIYKSDINGIWSQKTKIIGTLVGNSNFGTSLGLSTDGKTLAVGGPLDDTNKGAVWVFTEDTLSVWSEVAKLLYTGGAAVKFGHRVAISGNGAIILGGTNAAAAAGAPIYIIRKQIIGGVTVWAIDTSIGDVNGSFNGIIEGLTINRAGTVAVASRGQNDPNVFHVDIPSSTNDGQHLSFNSQNLIASGGSRNQGGSAELRGGTLAVGDGTTNDFIGGTFIWNITTRTVEGVQTSQGEFLTQLMGTGFFSSARQGKSVAISRDGKYIAVGGTLDRGGKGSFWIFKRDGQTWKQMNSKIAPQGATFKDNLGVPFEAGGAAALSMDADGDTLAVGTPGTPATTNTGTVDIYVRDNNNIWTLQANKLAGSSQDTDDTFGEGIALSADGNTLVVGSSHHNFGNAGQGAIWIFVRTGTTWSEQAGPLEGSAGTVNANMGRSVAISYDGNTVATGGAGDESFRGSVWIFVRTGTSWAQQGTKLNGDANTSGQGFPVALSADGNRLAMGASDHPSTGAAWIFLRTGISWALETITPLTVTGAEVFPLTMSMNANGDILAAGDWVVDSLAGAFWVFKRTGTAWAQYGDKIVSSDATAAAQFSIGLSISGKGNIGVVGANVDSIEQGAVTMFG